MCQRRRSKTAAACRKLCSRPDIWFPHTTLAAKLNQSQFSVAKEIAKKISLPLEAAIEELAVYQCSPFLELKKFGLSR